MASSRSLSRADMMCGSGERRDAYRVVGDIDSCRQNVLRDRAYGMSAGHQQVRACQQRGTGATEGDRLEEIGHRRGPGVESPSLGEGVGRALPFGAAWRLAFAPDAPSPPGGARSGRKAVSWRFRFVVGWARSRVPRPCWPACLEVAVPGWVAERYGRGRCSCVVLKRNDV